MSKKRRRSARWSEDTHVMVGILFAIAGIASAVALIAFVFPLDAVVARP